MKDINYWQQFFASGNVQDYLNYRCTQVNKEFVADHKKVSDRNTEVGVNSNAGVCERNGNGFESGAYRGI